MEETAALLDDATAQALRVVLVLPIADRLHSEGPKLGIDKAKLMVVNHGLDSSAIEQRHGLGQGILVLNWVDPNLVDIGPGETSHLQPHQGNLLDKGQV